MYSKILESNQSYSRCMEAMKMMNKQYLEEKEETSRIMGIYRLLSDLKRGDWKKVKMFFLRNLRRRKILQNNLQIAFNQQERNEKADYFSEERFVVYTVIFGKYDMVYEPLFLPDNCDFIIITDMELPKDSKWKKYDDQKLDHILKGYDQIEKNRILKMKPHLLFSEYKYSIYIDGNVQVITDLTEMINLIPECGIAMHRHNHRDCVYEEAQVLEILKREDEERLRTHIEHIREEKMPCHYGLLECNVIAREHNKNSVQKMMDDWWHEFQTFSKRDQISFPYVLYKNQIQTDEVAKLGWDVRKNYAFRLHEHKN